MIPQRLNESIYHAGCSDRTAAAERSISSFLKKSDSVVSSVSSEGDVRRSSRKKEPRSYAVGSGDDSDGSDGDVEGGADAKAPESAVASSSASAKRKRRVVAVSDASNSDGDEVEVESGGSDFDGDEPPRQISTSTPSSDGQRPMRRSTSKVNYAEAVAISDDEASDASASPSAAKKAPAKGHLLVNALLIFSSHEASAKRAIPKEKVAKQGPPQVTPQSGEGGGAGVAAPILFGQGVGRVRVQGCFLKINTSKMLFTFRRSARLA